MMQFTSHFDSQGWGPWWPNPKWEPSPILGLVNSWPPPLPKTKPHPVFLLTHLLLKFCFFFVPQKPMSLLAYLLSKSFSFTPIPSPTMFMSLDLPGTQNKVIANEWHVLARITFSPKQDHPWTHLLLDSIDSLMNVFSSSHPLSTLMNVFSSGHPLSTRPMCPSSSLSNIFSLIIVHYQRHIFFPAHSFSSLIFSSKKVLFLKHILSFTPFPPQRTLFFFWGPHLLRNQSHSFLPSFVSSILSLLPKESLLPASLTSFKLIFYEWVLPSFGCCVALFKWTSKSLFSPHVEVDWYLPTNKMCGHFINSWWDLILTTGADPFWLSRFCLDLVLIKWAHWETFYFILKGMMIERMGMLGTNWPNPVLVKPRKVG